MSPALRPTLSRTTVDVLVTAVVAFPTLMDAWWNQQGTRQADGITFALAGVAVVSLLGRRRHPLAVTLVCGAVLTAWYLMDHDGELLNLPTMVGLYTVAVQGDRRRSVLVGAVASAWSAGLAMAAGSTVGSPVLEMLWPLVPIALGEAVRSRHELVAEHADRAARAEAEREREARHRVQAERVRIAREFHDVVAHTMAAVNVQMGVAVAAFDAQPDTARRALAQARASSREALQELRATVTLLRDGSPTDATDPGDPAPAPRLAQIHELADTTRAAGVDVTISDSTSGDELPAAVELAAYRVVQEALTNVIRHADAAHATVALAHDDGHLVVDITDDGSTTSEASPRHRHDHGHDHLHQARPGPATGATDASADAHGGRDVSSGGHGLAGMAERAAALGGRLEHGPRATGGFQVRAVIPLPVLPTQADHR